MLEKKNRHPWSYQTGRHPSKYHTRSTNIETCFTRLPWKGWFLLFPSRTVFSQHTLRPRGSSNVNTRQLPSTRHHRIASHATVPVYSPTSPSRRPRSAAPVYIYLHFDSTTYFPTKPSSDSVPPLSHLRIRACLLLLTLSRSLGPGPAVVVSASRSQDPVCRRANCLGPHYFESPVTPLAHHQ